MAIVYIEEKASLAVKLIDTKKTLCKHS